MDSLIDKLIAAVAVAILGGLLAVVRPAVAALKAELAARKHTTEYRLARELAGSAVRFAESEGIKLDLKGKDKFDIAIDTLDTLLNKYGIDFNDDAVKNIILEDSVWLEFNSLEHEYELDLNELRKPPIGEAEVNSAAG